MWGDGLSGRFSGPLLRVLAAILVGLLAALVLVAVFDLAAWVVLGRSWAEVEEIQGLLMVWFGLLGAVYALGAGLHLSLELIAARLPAAARTLSRRLASAAVVVFGVLLAISAGRLTVVVDNTLPATGWSASFQYAPAVVAGVLLAAVALEQALRPPTEPAERSEPAGEVAG